MTQPDSSSPWQDDLFTPQAKKWLAAFIVYALIVNLASVVVGKILTTGQNEFAYGGLLLLIILIMRPVMLNSTLIGTLVGGTVALLWSLAFHGAFIEISHLTVVSAQFSVLNALLGLFVFLIAALAAEFIARMVDSDFNGGVLCFFNRLRG